MKRILSFILTVAIMISFTLFLNSCTYNDIEDTAKEAECKYGNYDYSKKPYLSFYIQSGLVIYKNNAYFIDSLQEIRYNSLDDLKDLRTTPLDKENPYKGYFICPLNEEHGHGQFAMDTDNCPGFVGYGLMFVLDAYESNGDTPIFYYCSAPQYGDEDEDPWNRKDPYSLYRYDSGSNTRESLYTFKDNPIQMMNYDNDVYLVVQSAKSDYKVLKVNKKTKEVRKVDFGSDYPEFIHADDGAIYVFDRYSKELCKLSRDLSDKSVIFTLPELIIFDAERTSKIRIYNGYIYYRADFDTKLLKWGLNDFYPYYYNIRRTPLETPGESEIVAENVFMLCDHGIYDNKLYFTPSDYGETIQGYYYNFNNGRLCAVDLDTLQTVDIASDTGLFFERMDGSIVTDKYFISLIRPTRSGEYKYTMNDAIALFMLYDYETGAMYPVYMVGRV